MEKNSGFTLVELMITIVIVSILLTVGVPSLRSFLQKNQLIAASNDLLSALHIARSEAIKRNKRVSVCASNNGRRCSGSTNWKTGWVAFFDEDGDLNGTGIACANNTTDCLLRVHAAVVDNRLTMTGTNSSYTFTSRGMPKNVAGTSQQGTFSLCSKDSAGNLLDSRAVALSLSGRVKISDNTAVITCP